MAKPKVLICDDDKLLLELIEYRLEAKGYEVVRAADGDEALSVLAKERPNLVVLDAMMPKTDGFEVLARIKGDPSLAETPVIMLTARKGEKDIVFALEKGADDYLVKPFIPEELMARLSRLLARKGEKT
jgi:DNA-binding response OmpR family regulator